MTIHVSQHFLRSSREPIPYVRANSFGSRMANPELIIVHDTVGSLVPGSSVRYIAKKTTKVSYHIIIERDGSITQMVPLDYKAYHAGISSWNGRSGCNSFSIGISLVSPGQLKKKGNAIKDYYGVAFEPSQVVRMATKEHGDWYWLPYTEAQIAALVGIVRALGSAYPTIKDVSTHWCVSPGRKIDTSPLLPLDDIKKALRGGKKGVKQPDGTLALGSTDPDGIKNGPVVTAQRRLAALGYHMVGTPDGKFGPRMQAAVLAFEAQNNLTYDGTLTVDELAVLFSQGAKSMPIGEREEATIEDLAAIGSREVAAGNKAIAVGGTAATVAVAEAAAEQAAEISLWDSAMGYLDGAVGVASKMTTLGVSVPPKTIWITLCVCGGLALVKYGRGIQWRRLAKHRLGIDTHY